MKADRGNNGRAYRQQPTAHHLPDDPYRTTRKPPEPTRCPECDASFQDGRWTWETAPRDAHEQLCPACQRIQDEFPAGYVVIRGDYLKSHRDEILALVANKEKREKAEHPLQRIMEIKDVAIGLQIATTDSHMARGIGEALHSALQGDLKIKYSKDENLIRVAWKR
jgi:NMD protein affecting ribosome stability and mRNA decay